MARLPARSTLFAWSLTAAIALMVGCRGEAEQRVRASAYRHFTMLETHDSVVDDAEVDRYVDEMARMILDAARRIDGKRVENGRYEELDDEIDAYDRFDVVVVHSMALNAWVYGDDFTCVTTNLLLQAEHPEEVAAVLCHEYAHLREGHIIEANERQIGNRTISAAISIAGQAGDIAAAAFGVPMPLSISSVTNVAASATRQGFDPRRPSDEFEADEYGIELYAALGLDRECFDDFLERMVEIYGDCASPSHPSTVERLERARKQLARIDDDEWSADRRLDADRFAEIQMRLRTLLVDRLRAGQLVAFEETGAISESSLVMTSCAPPPVDYDRLRSSFYEALRRPGHRRRSSPADPTL